MKFGRSSGILLHISSLPNADGIGDLGPEAYRFIDFLARTNTKLWQILPLNPTGYGNSPYQGLSAFAGNPLFINLNMLIKEKLLKDEDLEKRPRFPTRTVDFSKVIAWKTHVLNLAFKSYKQSPPNEIQNGFLDFQESNQNWLDDFTTFMTARIKYNLVSWSKWPKSLRVREEKAITNFKHKHTYDIEKNAFFQYLFARQWQTFKKYANDKGIKIIGDIPIFVGYDCADVWSHPELFFLDAKMKPTVVAGVPPDFFSETGQLWGNPLFDWAKHKKNGYQWWIERIKQTLALVDIVRLDHFRGFAGYWEIPADAKTAEIGRWVKGPGIDFFGVVKKAIGDLPFIAEDLGVITPDVIAMRKKYKLPGMKILQFGFDGDPDHEFQPHNYTIDSVAYTGTHDNDTTIGWYKSASILTQLHLQEYLNHHRGNVAWEMIRILWSCVSIYAIAPMQDFLKLGNKARMNYPGSLTGNWLWRMKPNAINNKLERWLTRINYLYRRD
ncbi:MAG TPA: 4-alpha-glucanotransferase [Anaerolineae bacterium]|nr:4-alpha-glucanotransferase [Anaerolineae bacterium]